MYSELSETAKGIASVSYVNRMVNAAGNAADKAEQHAAGAYAISAAESATETHKVLGDKVDVAQGTDNANKAMATDKAGTVYPGYITADTISPDYLAGGEEAITGVLKADRYGSVSWRLVSDLIGSGILRAGMIKTEIGTNNTGVFD